MRLAPSPPPRWIPTTALAVVLVAAAAAPAWAQGASHGPSTDADAERLLTQGLEALDRSDFALALRRLRASHALRPRAIVMLNIAQALRGSGETVEAIRAYLEYLRMGGASLAPDRVAMVRATIDHLSTSIATLTVQSRPLGANVRVDGTSVGRTPLTEGLVFSAGDHLVELDLEGFVIVRETVHLAARQRRTLNFRLAEEATAASLTVTVPPPVPSGTSILLDGIDLGGSTVARQVSAGGHRVEVRAPGHDAFDEELILGPRQRRSVSVRLQPTAPLLARPWFWITVGVVAAGGAVAAALLAQGVTDPATRPNTPVIVITDPMMR